jgi:VCBS repeat-containing protein
VLQWLQVSTAATGLSVALLAAPVAQADEGAPSGASSVAKPGTGSARGDAAPHTKTPRSSAFSARPVTKRPATDTTVTTAATTTTPAVASRTQTYPAPVSAPVTVRAILTEPLHWLGLDKLDPPQLPIPTAPVPDLIAAAWVGVRRAHYTVFNSTPTLTYQPYTTDPDTTITTGDLDAHDADGDTVKYSITKPPAHGEATIDDNGTYTYTPDPAFAHAGGRDSFTITVTDDTDNPFHIHTLTHLARAIITGLHLLGLTPPPNPFWHNQTITVLVQPVNHSPTITATVLAADPATGGRIITATASDPDDGDRVTLSVTPPLHAASFTELTAAEKTALGLSSDTTAWRYTPTSAFVHTGGTDPMMFTATDTHGTTTTRELAITVDAINYDPTAVARVDLVDPLTGRVTGTVTGDDTDGDTLTYTITGEPARGNVISFDPTTAHFAYDPTPEARDAAAQVAHVFVSGPNFNSVNMSYQPWGSATISDQFVVFDSAMQAGGTFTFSVNVHAGGGSVTNIDEAWVQLSFYRGDDDIYPKVALIGDVRLSQASGSVPWTDINGTYTLSEADAAQTAYAVVYLVGVDGDALAGNYGPQWVMPTLAFNDNPTNILYNPEFGQTAQGWLGGIEPCGSGGGASACATNSGVGANAGGGGYDRDGGTPNGKPGGYSSTLTAAQTLPTINTPPAELSDSFEVTVTDGHGGSTTVLVTVPVTPSTSAEAAPQGG